MKSVWLDDFNLILFWCPFYKCVNRRQRVSSSGTSVNNYDFHVCFLPLLISWNHYTFFRLSCHHISSDQNLLNYHNQMQINTFIKSAELKAFFIKKVLILFLYFPDSNNSWIHRDSDTFWKIGGYRFECYFFAGKYRFPTMVYLDITTEQEMKALATLEDEKKSECVG